jgi:hypothetical protein
VEVFYDKYGEKWRRKSDARMRNRPSELQDEQAGLTATIPKEKE